MAPSATHEEYESTGGSPLPDGTRPTPSRLWIWFLALEAVFALVYFPFGFPSGSPRMLGFLPWMEWPGQVPAWALLGLSAVAAIAYGIRRNRPNAPIAWWFLAFGVLLFITGDTTYKFWHQIIGNNQIPFPSFVDAIYVTMYPVLAIGLLLLARARFRGGDRASILDALTITLGMGLLSWTFLIGPNVRGAGGVLVRLTAAAYPLGDVLVLAMLAHLWSSGGLRHTAGKLLAIGALGTLAADSIYGLANLHPSWNWSDGNPVDLGWIIFYACWGAAALHPSMRALSEPRPASAPRTSNARLVLLAAVSLIAPAVLLVETAIGKPVDAQVIAVVAAAMFLFVLLRMAGLVQAHQQAMTREQVLREAAGQLVAASGREGIYKATINAVSDLVAGHGEIAGAAFVVSNPAEGLTVAAESGRVSKEIFELLDSRTDLRRTLDEGKVVRCSLEPGSTPPGATEPDSPQEMLICPLGAKDQLQGFIVVASKGTLPVELMNTIETLAAQAGLSLDREALTATFHERRSEARFQTLVQNASDVILIARPDATITYQSPSATRILGYRAGIARGPADNVARPLRRRRAGSGDVHGSRVPGGTVRHDAVAGAPSRRLLEVPRSRGEQPSQRSDRRRDRPHDARRQRAQGSRGGAQAPGVPRRAERSGEPCPVPRPSQARTGAGGRGPRSSLAVLFLDLDDFKLVNDSLGHAAGDNLLVAVAGRLTKSLRAGDTAARFGGDEFAVLLEEISGLDEACDVAARIIAELRVPLAIEVREVQVHASIGIAISPIGEEDPAELLQAADVAMYAAKGRGKGSYEVYQPALQAAMVERLERTADLQRAVDGHEFVVHYQPIVNLDGGETIGVEALVRWRHPERGLLAPKEFIALAEETGLIIPLGRWVLLEACQQARRWQLNHDLVNRLRVSVNISARHFQHDGLVQDVSKALRAADLAPKSLVLEITESVLVQDADSVIARMLELKSLGVAFAIDDFGTGYSSLSYLKRFPIDILKVDKSFVDDVTASPETGVLAEAIVQLGNTLHLQTVAEGIEQPHQVDGLRALGCQFGQGFYFAKPLRVEQVDELLSSLPVTPVESEVDSRTTEPVA